VRHLNLTDLTEMINDRLADGPTGGMTAHGFA
jgi:hypothetical protein